MLPCIYEGEPSQDPETLQQSAVDTLLSRCGQKVIPLPPNGATIPLLPGPQGPLTCGPFPIERQPPKGRGTFCLGRGSVKDNSAFQSKGNFAAQFKDASAVRFNVSGPSSGSVSGSGSERLCFCSDLQRYIQSHVLFPSLPWPHSGDFARLLQSCIFYSCSPSPVLSPLQHYMQSRILLPSASAYFG